MHGILDGTHAQTYCAEVASGATEEQNAEDIVIFFLLLDQGEDQGEVTEAFNYFFFRVSRSGHQWWETMEF